MRVCWLPLFLYSFTLIHIFVASRCNVFNVKMFLMILWECALYFLQEIIWYPYNIICKHERWSAKAESWVWISAFVFELYMCVSVAHKNFLSSHISLVWQSQIMTEQASPVTMYISVSVVSEYCWFLAAMASQCVLRNTVITTLCSSEPHTCGVVSLLSYWCLC